MTTLEKKLREMRNLVKIGLMTHVVIGYPSLSETEMIIETMAENGADMIELQIPFSDPLADGITIMRACEESLKNGTKVKDAFSVMRHMSKKISVPLLFMAYYNTVFHYGVKEFCEDAKSAGSAGLIVPDIPIDEEKSEHFFNYCKQNNLHTIHVVSPGSSDERLRKNASVANGFVYCTARQGITGAKDLLDRDVLKYLKRIKKHISLPLAVGFGISKREHLQVLSGHADVAVVGSALIDIISGVKGEERKEKISRFLINLKR